MKGIAKLLSQFIGEIPDAVKVTVAGFCTWLIASIDADIPFIVEKYKPVIALIKYGTAIVLLLYMVLKLIEQTIKVHDKVKRRINSRKEKD